MPSSTWRHEFGELKQPPGRMVALIGGMLAGPAAWLLSLELGYALSYLACDLKQTWFLHLAVLAPLLLVAGALIALWSSRSSLPDNQNTWPTWLFRAGVALCLGFTIVILANEVPLFVLDPCRV